MVKLLALANHNCRLWLFLFFVFLRKWVLTFHVNHLPCGWFTWNVKTYFLWKKKSRMLQILLGALRLKASHNTKCKYSTRFIWIYEYMIPQYCIISQSSLPYLPYYWDTLSTYHTCPKIWSTQFYYLLMCLKYCCTYGKQCRPWPATAFCGIWSGSTLFAKAYLSQHLG